MVETMQVIPDYSSRLALGRQWGPATWEPRLRRWWEKTSFTEPWCAAVSGGPDSIALLLLLEALPKRPDITILHFDHRMRGEASAADAALVRQYAETLGWPLVMEVRDPNEAADNEDQLRRARHGFFARAMDKAQSRVLWTGHQLDDLLETMLMRLCRGSGSAGLAAPRPVQTHRERVFLRPLLSHPAASLRTTLEDAGMPFRIDASNASPRYWRNRLRAAVIPSLIAHSEHDPHEGAARSRRQLEEDAEALDFWADEVWTGWRGFLEKEPEIFPSAQADLPEALRRRLFDRWLREHDLEIPAARRDAFRAALAARENTVFALAPDLSLRVANGLARLERAGEVPDLPDLSLAWAPFSGGMLWPPTGGILRARWLSPNELAASPWQTADPVREAYLAWPTEGEPPLRVRNRRPGDRFQPLGAPGSLKLKKLPAVQEIPPGERPALPLVCAENGAILWIPGTPPAQSHRVTGESLRVLYLTYEAAPSN